MAAFAETDAGAAFIASAASRETSNEIMETIAYLARSADEAELVWNGDGFGAVCHPSDIWEIVTGNGVRDADNFCWGAAGSRWWGDIQSVA